MTCGAGLNLVANKLTILMHQHEGDLEQVALLPLLGNPCLVSDMNG